MLKGKNAFVLFKMLFLGFLFFPKKKGSMDQLVSALGN